MFCDNCGSKLVDGAKFCDSCGEAVTEIIINKTKNKTISIKEIIQLAAILGVAVLLCGVLFFDWANPILIKGRWEVDGAVVLEFLGDGSYIEYTSRENTSGKMQTYSVKGDTLKLIEDSRYISTYTIEVSLFSLTVYDKNNKEEITFKRAW